MTRILPVKSEIARARTRPLPLIAWIKGHFGRLLLLIQLLSLGLFPGCKNGPQNEQQEEVIKVAFFDTDFCESALKSAFPTHVEIKLRAHGKPQALVCALPIDHPRRHGDRVLMTFLRNLTVGENKINIDLYSVFDSSDIGRGHLWQRAWGEVRERESAIVFSAVATKDELQLSSDPLVMLASGQWGGAVTKNERFYPHELLKSDPRWREQTVVIGSYELDDEGKGAFKDYTLLYPELIDYAFALTPTLQMGFRLSGSSYALGVAAARTLNFCARKLQSASALKACLKARAQALSLSDGSTLEQF